MANLNGSLLWSIQHPNKANLSYLFGTMHVKDYRAFVWREHLQSCISLCDTYAAESEIDVQRSSTSHLFLPSGQTLSSLMGPASFSKVRTIIQKAFFIDIHMYDKYLPIITSNIIAESILTSTESTSLDADLWAFAKSEGKQTVGVESANKQLEILENIPIDYQVKSLKQIAKNVKRYRQQLISMIGAYESQNTSYLYKSTKSSLGVMRKYMLYDRNFEMARTIHSLIERNKSFIGIGAAHLYGNKGVLALLKRNGSKVKPILMK